MEKSEASHAQESSIEDTFASPEARFECPICLAWLRDPVLTSCGHRFCRACIYSWLEREKACPVDNMKLDVRNDIFPDNFTRREISQHRTKCPNIILGCLEELSPLDVETHLNVCTFTPPQLPDNEKLRCSYVDVGCLVKFEDEPALQHHLQDNVQQHLALVAQAYTKMQQSSGAASTIAQQANFWDPPSKNPTEDLPGGEVKNLLKDLYEKNIILEQKTREQDIIIANMSAQIATLNLNMSLLPQRYCNGCFLWTFTDFKNRLSSMQQKPQQMYYSPGFYSSPNGYKFCLRLNLSPKQPNYLAILVHMMKSDHDQTLNWPFTGQLSITLVHPKMQRLSIKETMMTRPELDSFKCPIQELNPKGYGYSEFATLEYLIEQEFIVNNQLLIKVQAQTI